MENNCNHFHLSSFSCLFQEEEETISPVTTLPCLLRRSPDTQLSGSPAPCPGCPGLAGPPTPAPTPPSPEPSLSNQTRTSPTGHTRFPPRPRQHVKSQFPTEKEVPLSPSVPPTPPDLWPGWVVSRLLPAPERPLLSGRRPSFSYNISFHCPPGAAPPLLALPPPTGSQGGLFCNLCNWRTRQGRVTREEWPKNPEFPILAAVAHLSCFTHRRR